jgi:hypothetical protein
MSNPVASERTEMLASFRPGQPWLDTKGERIQAHGGSIHYEDGVFYWYGENKERTIPGSGIWHWGVRCYSSTDLYNWEDRGLIIPPEPDDPEHPMHPASPMDRPHIIKNEETGKYVCFLKVMSQDANAQRTTVLTADSILGPYSIVNRSFKPAGMHAGDFDLVIEPSDGKGYYYFSRPHSELICADLTPDYTDVTGYYSTHFPHPGPPSVREAPTYFRRGGKHYLITSGTTHYFPNQSEVASAPSYHGPWTVLGDPHPGDKSHTSYRSQISCIFKHPERDLYIALADRWLPQLSPEQSNVQELFERFAEPGATDPTVVENIDPQVVEVLTSLNDVNTAEADYVWLPIEFDGDRPIIRWRDEWRVEDFV